MPDVEQETRILDREREMLRIIEAVAAYEYAMTDVFSGILRMRILRVLEETK